MGDSNEYRKPLSDEEVDRCRFHIYAATGERIKTLKSYIELCRFVYSNPTTRWEMVMLDEVQKESLNGSTTRSR
jgi:hypothetical protein